MITTFEPMRRWSATAGLPPSTTRSPITVEPATPAWPQIRQVRPIRTLWPICTWLSILVPSPIVVSAMVPRSMQLLAPTSTSSPITTEPSELIRTYSSCSRGGDRAGGARLLDHARASA